MLALFGEVRKHMFASNQRRRQAQQLYAHLSCAFNCPANFRPFSKCLAAASMGNKFCREKSTKLCINKSVRWGELVIAKDLMACD